jgi:hypothetical protein
MSSSVPDLSGDIDHSLKDDTENKQKKESLIGSLLAGNTSSVQKKGSGILIEEVGTKPETSSTQGSTSNSAEIKPSSHVKPPPAPVDDGPSMFDLMMEAQKQAATEKTKEKQEIQQKESKKSFGGFKKGFFGNSPASSSSSSSKKNDSEIIDVKPATKASAAAVSSSSSAAAKKASATAPILADVQQALKEEEKSNPVNVLMNNSKEWMTNDLVSYFQTNPILARGFQNPKCLDAMKLMQSSNPKEAMIKYQHDVEVSAFMREFGKVMSDHFTKLGEQQQGQQGQQTQQQGTQQTNAKVIEEIGPLQAKVLKESKSTADIVAKKKSVSPAEENEEERVKRILEDSELREMLMDPELQKILMECSDPKRLSYHMKQPETFKKIQKLQKSGLIKIEI